MTAVVWLRGVGGPIHHVVAPSGGALPVVGRGIQVMHLRAVQQRLRWDAADVRAAATEPAAIDDGDRGAELAGLVGGRLAARAGADDHEVEGGMHRSQSEPPVWPSR